MKGVIGISLAVLAVLLLAGSRLADTRRDLEIQRRAANAAWAEVDIALDRRAGLALRLVDAVRDASRQLRTGLSEITQASLAFGEVHSARGRMEAYARLDAALSMLLTGIARDPEFLPVETLNRLRDELDTAENLIAIKRRRYNDAVQKYNTSIELFPNNIAASLFGFARIDAYFQTEPAGQDLPQRKL